MARSLRLQYPGAFYHIFNRGNAKEKIFLTHRDREKFLEYLETHVYRVENFDDYLELIGKEKLEGLRASQELGYRVRGSSG